MGVAVPDERLARVGDDLGEVVWVAIWENVLSVLNVISKDVSLGEVREFSFDRVIRCHRGEEFLHVLLINL